MKSGQLFWGFFLLAIGALFLLTKYDLIFCDFSFVWDIWPLIFVLWGIMVIFKNALVRPIISAIFGIFLALMLFGIFANIFTNLNFSIDSKGDHNESYSEEYTDSIKYADLTLNSGAGMFEIKEVTDKLVEGESYGSLADYDFNSDTYDSSSSISFNLGDKHINIFNGKIRNHLTIKLNENPIWDFDLNFGAAKSKFDLSNFKVRDLRIGTGASNINLKLGDRYDMTNVRIEMGAANLRIYIPQNSGCRVYGDMVLISRNLDGFIKKDSNDYETSNYADASNKIDIQIDGGVSSIKVIKY